MKRLNILLLASVALLSSCSHDGWSVKGTIANAPEGAKVSVEGFNAGRWYNIDSVEIKSNGSFAYTSPEGSPYPDIYRVSLNGRAIYFPIDSLENIQIDADASTFDTDYTLTGWDTAERFSAIDKRLAQAIATEGAQAVLTDSLLKREISEVITADDHGLIGYYLINKTIGDKPLFAEDNRADVRVIGAIANKFYTQYPNDPRTAYLRDRFLRSRVALNPEAVQALQIEANESGLLEIELFDPKGNKQKLSDVAARSGLTLLDFTSYMTDISVPYNVELNRLYELYKDKNLNIYQVCIDSDEVEWRKNAQNLPWTAVWYDQQDGGTLLRLYNVAVIPTTYIIDRNGDLVERVEDPTQLEAAIRKHI